MNRICISALAASLLAIATPAFAADLVANTPKAAPPVFNTTTLSFEAGPTFSQKAGPTFNQLSNTQWTAGLSYVLAPNWSVNATLKDQIKNDTVNGGTTGFYQLQGTIGYRAKLSDMLAVTFSGGVGMGVGATGYSHGVASLTGTDTFMYYLAGVGLDVKLDQHWTWNAINVQYKNGFNVDYLTPFASTGLTYAIDAHNAVYGKATYNWSDYGHGSAALAALSDSVVVGYKYSF